MSNDVKFHELDEGIDDKGFTEEELNLVEIDQIKHDLLCYEKRKKELEDLEKELYDLKNCFNEFGELIFRQEEGLEKIEEKTENVEINIEKAIVEIKEIDKIDSDFKARLARIGGGALVGGALFGGIGGIFGAIPGLLGATAGTAGGVIAGNFIPK